MLKRSFPGSTFLPAMVWIAVSYFTLCSGALAQDYYSPQEVHVDGLSSLMARSHEPSDVLLTSLDTIIHDRTVCCGEDSALEVSLAHADPLSLKDVAAKVQGRQLLSDGRPIMVTADFVEPTAISAGWLITVFHDKHAVLLAWNSHIYVCFGVTYLRDYDASTGAELDTIHKLLLLDTRYSDSRRETVFDRATDDASKIQGMLRVTFAPQ